MTSQPIKIIIGFLLLFTLYHAAEYFVLFTYQPVGFLALQVVFFITALLLAKWQGYEGFATWGLDNQKGWFKNLLLGMSLGVILYGGTFGISLWLKSEEIVQIPALSSIWQQLALFGLGTFFSSFSEDILTRGYLYRHIAPKTSTIAFGLLSAIVYLLNHIYRLADGLETLLYIFLLGVLFVIPVIFTKRLWLTGGMHWIGNTTFFYTHSLIEVKENPGHWPPNSIFIAWILLLIPLLFLLLSASKMSLENSSYWKSVSDSPTS